MKTAYSKVGWTVGLMSVSVVALAGEPKTTPPQEPAGFVVGGVIGGLAAGPIGAVVGAGIGTWLGNRVHKAGEATKAEAQVAVLQTDKEQLQTEKAVLITEKGDLSDNNKALTARLDQLSHSVETAQTAKDDATKDDAAKVLDGLQGDVLFRTGSADITPEMTHGIQMLAEAVAKSPALKGASGRLRGSSRHGGKQPQIVRSPGECGAGSLPRGRRHGNLARNQRVRFDHERGAGQ
jgi:hypothetical protein